MMGVRVLDLRLSFDPRTKTFYVTHTLTCLRWHDAAQQVADFLRLHPTEVVVVVVADDWHHRKVWFSNRNERKFAFNFIFKF